jgi:hypothetical protein
MTVRVSFVCPPRHMVPWLNVILFFFWFDQAPGCGGESEKRGKSEVDETGIGDFERGGVLKISWAADGGVQTTIYWPISLLRARCTAPGTVLYIGLGHWVLADLGF